MLVSLPNYPREILTVYELIEQGKVAKVNYFEKQNAEVIFRVKNFNKKDFSKGSKKPQNYELIEYEEKLLLQNPFGYSILLFYWINQIVATVT